MIKSYEIKNYLKKYFFFHGQNDGLKEELVDKILSHFSKAQYLIILKKKS